jgi:hypothetical protein
MLGRENETLWTCVVPSAQAQIENVLVAMSHHTLLACTLPEPAVSQQYGEVYRIPFTKLYPFDPRNDAERCVFHLPKIWCTHAAARLGSCCGSADEDSVRIVSTASMAGRFGANSRFACSPFNKYNAGLVETS